MVVGERDAEIVEEREDRLLVFVQTIEKIFAWALFFASATGRSRERGKGGMIAVSLSKDVVIAFLPARQGGF